MIWGAITHYGSIELFFVSTQMNGNNYKTLLGEMIPKHPTQLYEATAYFLCFVILIAYYLFKQRKPKNGVLFGGFLVMVFTSRLIIEHWKEVQEAWEASMVLNMGQILSLPFIVAGILFLVLAFMNKTGKIVDIASLKLKEDKKK